MISVICVAIGCFPANKSQGQCIPVKTPQHRITLLQPDFSETETLFGKKKKPLYVGNDFQLFRLMIFQQRVV